jgi:hypothetical protein
MPGRPEDRRLPRAALGGAAVTLDPTPDGGAAEDDPLLVTVDGGRWAVEADLAGVPL